MTRLLILILVMMSVGVVPRERIEAQEPSAPKPTCTESLQTIIDNVAPGNIVTVRTDCIYREEVLIASPVMLDGQGGAEIRGSDVWTLWIPADGLWVSANTVPLFQTEGECDPESDSRCLWPEQVFRDGTPLHQVSSGVIPGPGEFSLNVGRQVVIAEDPANATIEVTTRPRWMQVSANDVAIQGFTMKHAATDAQQGGISIDDVSGWTLRDNVLSDAHGANLYFRNTSNGQLVDNEMFNGGQLGFAGQGVELRISGNSVHHNNTEAFSAEWEAGGAKMTESVGVEIDGNEFFLNDGPGYWCDIDCADVTISNNDVFHNNKVGIYFEISDGAEIYGNRVWSNVWNRDAPGWAGIFISSSSNAQVHDNIVAWNGDGIIVLSQCRGFLADGTTCDTSHPWNNVTGNEVRRNTIIMAEHDNENPAVYALGWTHTVVDEAGRSYPYMFSDEARNRGYGNLYWIPPNDRSGEIGFAWGGTDFAILDQFNATPGEEFGRYLDPGERDQALKEAGIPLMPDYPADPFATPET